MDVGFWAGVVPGNLGELAALHAAGVLGFKCFLADSGATSIQDHEIAQWAASLLGG